MSCPCGQHKTPQGCAGASVLAALPADVKRRKSTGKPPASRRRGPDCACGCGRPCFRGCRYASQACISRAVRSSLTSVGRQADAAGKRAQRYIASLNRLGPRVTREDLIALLDEEFHRGYKAHQGAVRRGGREVAA